MGWGGLCSRGGGSQQRQCGEDCAVGMGPHTGMTGDMWLRGSTRETVQPAPHRPPVSNCLTRALAPAPIPTPPGRAWSCCHCFCLAGPDATNCPGARATQKESGWQGVRAEIRNGQGVWGRAKGRSLVPDSLLHVGQIEDDAQYPDPIHGKSQHLKFSMYKIYWRIALH